jgi:dinuclear metal center YbgI/SA1388 family protein
MKIRDLIHIIEEHAPLSFQEGYDNSGLLIGGFDEEVNKALICIDITEDILNEAAEKNCDIIISHHPLIFKGLKRITESCPTERIIKKAIKNNIAIYSAHTNLDNTIYGVSHILAEKLGLKELKILEPKAEMLSKLVTFCPLSHSNQVRQAIFDAGGGKIGNYDCCSYNISGEGSFRALEGTNPYVGEKNKIHFENETRIEVIFPKYLEDNIVRAMIAAHPYEEVAFDLYPLNNKWNQVGSGVIGNIEPREEIDFLMEVKKLTGVKTIKHSKLRNKPVGKVAICGGSGSFLINRALKQKADIFITSDIKYHDFMDVDNNMILADIGHYESEQFSKELIYNVITKKIPNFAVLISEINTNPVYYL